MIVADPAMRFKDANELAFAVEALIERIGLGGHVMDLSAPQKCVYCAEGHYKIIAEPLYENRQEARDKTANFSYMHAATPPYSDPVWGVFVCDHCGNVQIFRPDQAKDPKVWKKS